MDMAYSTEQFYDIEALPDLHSRILTWILAASKLSAQILIVTLECLFGLYLGAVAGWCGGWCTGNVYQNTCNSGTFTSFEEIRLWCNLPHTFGQYGTILGAAIGVICVIFISRRIKRNRILELYRNGTTRPCDLAKFTGISRQKVESILIRLERA